MTARTGIAVLFFAFVTLSACSKSADADQIKPDNSAADIVQGDREHGEALFMQGKDNVPACRTCHLNTSTAFGAAQMTGPNLVGVGERAETRINGMEARDYLHQSILSPNEFVVEGYNPLMFPGYAMYLSEQDISDLIAYLLEL